MPTIQTPLLTPRRGCLTSGYVHVRCLCRDDISIITAPKGTATGDVPLCILSITTVVYYLQAHHTRTRVRAYEGPSVLQPAGPHSMERLRLLIYGKPKLQKWVDRYKDEKSRRNRLAAETHYEHLLIFAKTTNREIYDLTMSDIDEYRKVVNGIYSTRYHRDQAMTSLRCFLRFYRARGHHYLMSLPKSDT